MNCEVCVYYDNGVKSHFECCCEFDRKQVLDDIERVKNEGYIEVNGRWIKPSKKSPAPKRHILKKCKRCGSINEIDKYKDFDYSSNEICSMVMVDKIYKYCKDCRVYMNCKKIKYDGDVIDRKCAIKNCKCKLDVSLQFLRDKNNWHKKLKMCFAEIKTHREKSKYVSRPLFL